MLVSGIVMMNFSGGTLTLFHIPNSFMNYYLSSCQSRPLINLIIAEGNVENATTSSRFNKNVCKADANNLFLP